MATSLAQAVDHLPRVDYTRPHYEQRPYVLVVAPVIFGRAADHGYVAIDRTDHPG